MDYQEILDKIGTLPRAQRLAAIAVIYVIFALLFYFVLYSPKQGEQGSLRAQQAELQSKKTEVERRAQDKEAFEKELENLTAQLKLALRQLPDNREIPDLLSRISTIARRIGLEIRSFLPKSEVLHEFHAEVPVQLEVGGSYHEVAMFFDRLSKLGRIVYVQDIEIKNPVETGGKVELTVTGTLTTFRFLSEEERVKQAEAKKATGRRAGRKKK